VAIQEAFAKMPLMKSVLLPLIFLFAVATLASAQEPVPKLVSMPDPVYSADGIAMGFGGKIRVYVEVSKDGTTKVTGANGPMLRSG
jgi:hypothetical protein